MKLTSTVSPQGYINNLEASYEAHLPLNQWWCEFLSVAYSYSIGGGGKLVSSKHMNVASSISAYRGSGELSTKFWPIMNSGGWWQRRGAATLQVPKEIQRNSLSGTIIVSAMLYVFLLSSHDSLGCQDSGLSIPTSTPGSFPKKTENEFRTDRLTR